MKTLEQIAVCRHPFASVQLAPNGQHDSMKTHVVHLVPDELDRSDIAAQKFAWGFASNLWSVASDCTRLMFSVENWFCLLCLIERSLCTADLGCVAKPRANFCVPPSDWSDSAGTNWTT